MNNRCAQNAMACIGAVVGAGFASGREVVAFFSSYGVHSWWLILLSAVASMTFCALCMRASRQCCANGWYRLYEAEKPLTRRLARMCGLLLSAVVAGAMASASGHIVQLLWSFERAYLVGAVGTLLLAWTLGFGTLKPLALISWTLTGALMLAVLLALRHPPAQADAIALQDAPLGFWQLVYAALRAVCYAAMNITIAMGVVCGCSPSDGRLTCRTSALFGLMLAALLLVSNHLYLSYATVSGDAFPIVRLLGGFGRAGFVGSALLLYFAILTTLVALVRALRNAVESYAMPKPLSVCLTLAPPLALSAVGFSEIVGAWYAPIGLMCMLFILWPLARRGSSKGA